MSSELGVSLPYSPVGYGWGCSVLGSEMSCIALCELINHADVKAGDSGEYTALDDSDFVQTLICCSPRGIRGGLSHRLVDFEFV